MYRAVITISSPKLFEVFAAEDKELSNGRGSYEVTAIDDGVEITAVADDAVAFRAVLNAVSKVAATFENMQKVQ